MRRTKLRVKAVKVFIVPKDNETAWAEWKEYIHDLAEHLSKHEILESITTNIQGDMKVRVYIVVEPDEGEKHVLPKTG